MTAPDENDVDTTGEAPVIDAPEEERPAPTVRSSPNDPLFW
ncbi:hypothetical protein [Actinokineospora sp. HUAS TT18]